MGEQALPTPGKESVTRRLIALIEERERKGIETYGCSLETFNGRDPVRDLIEEMVDAFQYALQYQMERRAMLDQIDELTRQRDMAIAQDYCSICGRSLGYDTLAILDQIEAKK